LYIEVSPFSLFSANFKRYNRNTLPKENFLKSGENGENGENGEIGEIGGN